jgi:hypothetical protein
MTREDRTSCVRPPCAGVTPHAPRCPPCHPPRATDREFPQLAVQRRPPDGSGACGLGEVLGSRR